MEHKHRIQKIKDYYRVETYEDYSWKPVDGGGYFSTSQEAENFLKNQEVLKRAVLDIKKKKK